MTSTALLIVSPVVYNTILRCPVNSSFPCVCININESRKVIRETEVVQQTSLIRNIIIMICHTMNHTNTCIRNKVPNTFLIITTEDVREVKHYILMDIPIIVRLVVVLRNYTISPNTFKLRTETEARSKPFTNSDIESKLTTSLLEGIKL